MWIPDINSSGVYRQLVDAKLRPWPMLRHASLLVLAWATLAFQATIGAAGGRNKLGGPSTGHYHVAIENRARETRYWAIRAWPMHAGKWATRGRSLWATDPYLWISACRHDQRRSVLEGGPGATSFHRGHWLRTNTQHLENLAAFVASNSGVVVCSVFNKGYREMASNW